MKTIILTKGQSTIVDDLRYEELNKKKWYAQWNKYTKSYYAVCMRGKRPFRKQIQMHREIMDTPVNLICDHINHDTLDNREENLRNVTPSQSNMNRKIGYKNKSGEKNIFIRKSGSYEVRISKGGKAVFDKTFYTLDDAINARDIFLAYFHEEFRYSVK